MSVDLRQLAVLSSSRSTDQLSSKARVRNQCSSALPSGQPSRSHSAYARSLKEVRALTNIIGNGVATIVDSIWEGELDRAKMDAALADVDAEEAVAAELAPD